MKKLALALLIIWVLGFMGLMAYSLNRVNADEKPYGDLMENWGIEHWNDPVGQATYLNINGVYPNSSDIVQSAAGVLVAGGDYNSGMIQFYLSDFGSDGLAEVVVAIYEANEYGIPENENNPIFVSEPYNISDMNLLEENPVENEPIHLVNFDLGNTFLSVWNDYDIVLEGYSGDIDIGLGRSYLYPAGSYGSVWFIGDIGDTWYEEDLGVVYYLYAADPVYPPTGLLTNGRTNPLDLTTWNIHFSAIDTEQQENIKSFVYYAITVADNPEFNDPVWNWGQTTLSTHFDSGERSPEIPYQGKSLKENVTYYWRIRFWNDYGYFSEWSNETAYFRISPTLKPITKLLPASIVVMILLFGNIFDFLYLYFKMAKIKDIGTSLEAVEGIIIFLAILFGVWGFGIGALVL